MMPLPTFNLQPATIFEESIVSEQAVVEESIPEVVVDIAPEGFVHEEQYQRFRIGARIEHAILMVSFTVLAVTGLPQMFALTGWGQTLIWFLGGIESVREIHRIAAFVLIVGSVYHLFTSAYRLYVKHEPMAMLPTLKDARDLWHTVRHNLGFLAHPPKMGKFNFAEKLEYWALVWGTVIMIVTGFMLWNPIVTTHLLPGQVIPAAKAAHGYEALLAVLAIVIWHMYHVHIKQFNPSMFTGKLPRHQMEEEHALELERLERGGTPWPEVPAAILARRRRVFFAVSTVAGILILALLIWAFTFEQTAITTVPRVPREVFVPLP
jgi:cytochrome b subunit of formate dehydrogenase